MLKYIDKLNEWHENTTKSALLLYGPSGSGKSYIANEYLKHKEYPIFSYSILEIKNKKTLINLLKDVIKSPVVTSFFNNNVKASSIIIDDIDFTLIQKYELIELLEFKKNNPQYTNKIILITNNNYNLTSLKKYLYLLNITPPTYDEQKSLALSLLPNDSKLDYILEHSENDYRKLIYLCNVSDTNLEIYHKKDINDSIYEYTDKLYNNYTSIKDTPKFNEIFLEFNILYENTIHNVINNTTNDNTDKINVLNNIYNTYKYIYNLKYTDHLINDNYIFYYGIKNISYNYNKLNKNNKKNKINYPKNISIYNNKNLFTKTKLSFNSFPLFYKLHYKMYNLFIEYISDLKIKKDYNTLKKYFIDKNNNNNTNLINTFKRYSIINKNESI
jgi:hypothetical protein